MSSESSEASDRALVDFDAISFVESLFDNRDSAYTYEELCQRCEKIGRFFHRKKLANGYCCSLEEDGRLSVVLRTTIPQSFFERISSFLETKGIMVIADDFTFVPQGAASLLLNC